MASTATPFSMLEGFITNLPLPAPPDWMVEETQRRMVLLVNHVLMQEPQATARLVRVKGSVVQAQWRNFSLRLQVTPAGLFDLADAQARADLSLHVTESSPRVVVQGLAQGRKPPVRIEGDVQLAAELNWLADHVRWDIAQDLARIVGEAPAHMLVQAAGTVFQAVRQFVRNVPGPKEQTAGSGA